MSLCPQAEHVVPVETAKVAHAAFLRGHRCLTMAHTLSGFINDDTFRAYPKTSAERNVMNAPVEDGLNIPTIASEDWG